MTRSTDLRTPEEGVALRPWEVVRRGRSLV
jgi:hypothetical protein